MAKQRFSPSHTTSQATSHAGAEHQAARQSEPAQAGSWVLWLTSVAGLGYLPIAPGTFGTLAALPLWWLSSNWAFGSQLLLTSVLTLLAIWLAEQAERLNCSHDASSIVLDEVVGMLWASLALPWTWPMVLSAFVGFRLLDIGKPFPIGWLDRTVPGGLGVVIDDVCAGLMICGVLHLWHTFGGLLWA